MNRRKPVVFPTAALPSPPAHHTAEGTWQWILEWLKTEK